MVEQVEMPVVEQGEMTILEHLDELRRRLMVVVIAVVLGTVVGGVLFEPIVLLLQSPLPPDETLVVFGLQETPAIFFKISVAVGILVAMPVIVYEIFMFVQPGLEKHEKRYILIGTPLASLSFAAGVVFAALVLLPNAVRFLVELWPDLFERQLAVDKYLSFISTILIWAGVVFETPLIMFFLSKLGVITAQGFAKARRAVIIGAAALAAIITPTVDPVNMLLVMGPFLVLYEVGILLARIAEPKV